MKRRSSFGDGIGLQKDHTVKAAAEAATLIPSTQLAPNVLDNFRNVALCFAVVNFDIDQGAPISTYCFRDY